MTVNGDSSDSLAVDSTASAAIVSARPRAKPVSVAASAVAAQGRQIMTRRRTALASITNVSRPTPSAVMAKMTLASDTPTEVNGKLHQAPTPPQPPPQKRQQLRPPSDSTTDDLIIVSSTVPAPAPAPAPPPLPLSLPLSQQQSSTMGMAVPPPAANFVFGNSSIINNITTGNSSTEMSTNSSIVDVRNRPVKTAVSRRTAGTSVNNGTSQPMDIIIDNKPVPGAPRRAASAFTARDIPKRNHDSINSSIAVSAQPGTTRTDSAVSIVEDNIGDDLDDDGRAVKRSRSSQTQNQTQTQTQTQNQSQSQIQRPNPTKREDSAVCIDDLTEDEDDGVQKQDRVKRQRVMNASDIPQILMSPPQSQSQSQSQSQQHQQQYQHQQQQQTASSSNVFYSQPFNPTPATSTSSLTSADSASNPPSITSQQHQHQQRQQPRYAIPPKSTRHWSEIDEEEHDDPVMVAEYSEDIIDYSLKLEAETMPNPNYMDNQPELDFRMRGILIDWLIEVHHRFHMLGETLFMAVNLIDRFLTMNVVSLQKFQLVGITALFIAAKYEEIVVPPLASFLYLTDGGYSANEVKQAERYMLNALKFDVGYANPLNFLRRISKADDYDAASRTLAKYLMEMQCVHHKLIQYPPSLLAAAALCLARKMINKGPWDENLVHYSGYYIEQLEPCIAIMIEYMQDGIAHKAFHAKYASRKMLRVSVYATDWATKLVRDRVLVATPSAAASNVNSTTAAAFGDN